MRTRTLAPSLLLLVSAAVLPYLVAGCSRDQRQKEKEQPPTQVQAAKPDAAPAAVTSAPAPADPQPAKAPAREPAKRKPHAAQPETGSPMDKFAKCLSEQGAAMYGVFWCDHCREQKEKFGDSFQYVKYVECVAPDAPKTLIPECKAQGIKHTPTWVFPDGEHIEGVMGIDQLAMKTHCKLP
ncbi:MAG: hypothetical protein LAN37_09910 [Acidobacteriia bacterium]|nr:hypothetical protein [Terriglobia bacterium]